MIYIEVVSGICEYNSIFWEKKKKIFGYTAVLFESKMDLRDTTKDYFLNCTLLTKWYEQIDFDKLPKFINTFQWKLLAHQTIHSTCIKCNVDFEYTVEHFEVTYPCTKQYELLEKYRAALAECLLDKYQGIPESKSLSKTEVIRKKHPQISPWDVFYTHMH